MVFIIYKLLNVFPFEEFCKDRNW